MRGVQVSETFKGFIIAFVVFMLWSFGCFCCGYLLSDRRAAERIKQTNIELAEQQQKYDDLIRKSEERISNIREQLLREVSDNGKTATELSKLVEQIRKQKLDI